MPRRRRDRDDEASGGEFGGAAQGRRAPLYAVLARELLRHLGDSLAQGARVGEVGVGRSAGVGDAAAVTGELREDRQARGHAVPAEVIDRGVERQQGRLLAAMRVLRGGKAGVDLVGELGRGPQVAGAGGDVTVAGRRVEDDGVRPLEVRQLGPRLVGGAGREVLSGRVAGDRGLRRGLGDDTHPDASALGAVDDGQRRRVVGPRG